MKRIKKICLILVLNLLILSCYAKPLPAAERIPAKLQLSQTVSLATTNSSAYKKLKVKLELKQASLVSAEKSIKMKKKNLSTIRYSPLLSLKFPDKALETEEVEFIYKPLQIQSEITSIEHEMKDTLYAVKEEVSNLFIETYTMQEIIHFNEERLASMADTLTRNEARLLIGLASQTDVERMQKSISTLEAKLSTDERKLLSLKKKLGKKINLDITTGYELKNPYQKAQIGRDLLPSLIEYTLKNDHTYYQASAECSLALLLLDTNYSIISGKYDKKLNNVAAYVTAAKKGKEIDSYALKKAYDNFLDEIDKPWNGSFRILFIKIPKEWFKGSIDGSRFLQDDPYALYTCILDYQDKLREKENVKDEITAQVEEGFENLVTARSAYLQLVEDTNDLSGQVEAALYKNQIGQMTPPEYEALQQEYEDTQMSALDALSLYSQLLTSYDRLTCGAITKYLSGESLTAETAAGGNSYLINEEQEGVSYYIKMMLENYTYEFGIYVPEEFSIEITDYELWCGDYQIGERTPKDKTITHLAYGMKDAGKTFVRLYNGETLVDDCEFDPQEYTGALTITSIEAAKTKTEEVVGSYTRESNETLGTTTIQLQFKNSEIAYYTVHDEEERKLYSAEYISAGEGFTYLTFAFSDLSILRIHVYDAEKKELQVLFLNTENRNLVKEDT